MPTFADAAADAEETPAEEPAADAGGGNALVDRLLSTQPPVDPAHVADSLNLEAGPLGHLAAGLAKAFDLEDLPAIGHWIVAAYLVVSTATAGENGNTGDMTDVAEQPTSDGSEEP